MKNETTRKDSSIADISVVLDSIDAAVITINPQGCILEVNSACSRLFGYTDVELIGNNVSMLMPQPFRSEHDGYLNNHMQTGHSSIIGVGRHVSGLRADGTVFPVHLAVGKHGTDDQVLFTGILHDLTSQVEQMEDRARLGRILNGSLNEIYVFDSETLQFSTVSRGALVNSGYSRAEMLQMTPLHLKPLHNMESFSNLLEPLHNGEQERIQFSTVHQRKDGSQYDVSVSLSLSDEAEGKREFLAVIEDVTEKNRLLDMMQQSQRLDSIGQLTGGIAHDFNNILTVISGNLELLKSSIDESDLTEIIDDASDASQMGARLTERLLAFASRNTLMPTSISINSMVTDMIEFLRRTIGENIYLRTHLNPNLWTTRVDVSQLENSLINLAINARDAMPNGGTLSVTTDNVAHKINTQIDANGTPGDYVVLVVSDTGTGIAPKDLPRIYEPFFTTKPSSAGTGMGLSMVYGFVRQTQGFIEVESTENKGTTFCLFLPRDNSADTSESQAEPKEQQPAQGQKLVLLVEDDERVRRFAKRQLERLGHSIIEASDGYEALELFKHNDNIDLVFSDMIMSAGMTGFDLALKLREINSELSILLTSGYSNELLNIEQLAENGIELLRKPYSADALASKISET